MADTASVQAPKPPVTVNAIWQTIAYATHHDMPAPSSISLFPGDGSRRPHLALSVRTPDDAERWVLWLDLDRLDVTVFPHKDADHPGFTSWRGMWGGWSWNITAYHPVIPRSLAAARDALLSRSALLRPDAKDFANAALATVDGAR